MPHRTSRSRRYAGRAVVLSVLGWALFSRDRDELADDPAVERPFDFDVDWDLPAPDVPEPAPAPAPKDSARSRRRPKRRLATSLAFATLFFAGAALSAGAGDMIAEAVESTGSTSTEATEAPPEETVPAEEPPVEENPSETEPSEGGEDGSDPGDGEGGEDGSDPGDGEGGEEPDPDEGEGEQPSEGEDPDGGSGPGPDDDGSNGEGQGGNGGGHDHGSPEPPGAPIVPEPSEATESVPPDPEVATVGADATIWLHQVLPDPTPAARRLTPRFARVLRAETARANADWALVLGVLRAQGRIGRDPAGRPALRELSKRLVQLGANRDEWAAVLALRGRTAFADRAVAGARLHRAVGLRALVTGLQAAKPALERATLADRRISLYPGGREDIVAHRIDIRVLAAVRYLAEGFGQVTVSSLRAGHGLYSRPGVISAHVYGLAVDVAGLGGLSIVGNQGPGSITEQAVRSILLLPPGLQPRQVISLLGMGGASFAMANHHDHIHVGF